MPAVAKNPTTKLNVLLYVPNLIDYARLVILFVAWLNIDENPGYFLVLYLLQIILDFFDGLFAKMLNQVSSFGSWLDVVVDNIGRAMLWTYSVKFGFMISCIEWMTFCCNQRHGAEWKQKFLDAPYFFKLVFKNNFRTPLGLTAITAGLQILPVWLYVMKQYEGIYFTTTLNICIGYLILLYCVIGRAISLIIECWVIFNHVEILVHTDAKNANDKK